MAITSKRALMGKQSQFTLINEPCCSNCGEFLIGDGYSVVLHCPNADVDGFEPDANPVHCSEQDH